MKIGDLVRKRLPQELPQLWENEDLDVFFSYHFKYEWEKIYELASKPCLIVELNVIFSNISCAKLYVLDKEKHIFFYLPESCLRKCV